MTLILKFIRRSESRRNRPDNYVPVQICHGCAAPRVWTHRVAGMAFNFSAIEIPEQKKPRKGTPSRVDGGSLLNVFGTVPSF